MFLIAGLGNPGEEYTGNRHNVGYMVLEELGRRLGVVFRQTKMHALVADVIGDNSRLLLVKPLTFMNMSGRSIRTMRALFNVPLENILVVHDDLDLPFGEVRLKDGGGSAGHKGVQSVIEELGGEGFRRVRIGIGRPPGRQDPADFVLKDFKKKERDDLDFVISEAAELALKTADI